MSEYSNYPYATGGPRNGEAEAALAAKFTHLLSGLPGVYSICDLGCGHEEAGTIHT